MGNTLLLTQTNEAQGTGKKHTHRLVIRQTKIYVDSGRVLSENHCSDNLLLLCVLSKICSSVYRQQLLVAIMMHLSQQFSGINAVSGKYISTLPLAVSHSVYELES